MTTISLLREEEEEEGVLLAFPGAGQGLAEEDGAAVTNDGCSEHSAEAISCKWHSALIYVNELINSASTSPSETGDVWVAGGGNRNKPCWGCDGRGVCTAGHGGGFALPCRPPPSAV